MPKHTQSIQYHLEAIKDLLKSEALEHEPTSEIYNRLVVISNEMAFQFKKYKCVDQVVQISWNDRDWFNTRYYTIAQAAEAFRKIPSVFHPMPEPRYRINDGTESKGTLTHPNEQCAVTSSAEGEYV